MHVLSFPASCPPLDPPDNGSITHCSGMSVGDICLLECDPGFELSGDDTRVIRLGMAQKKRVHKVLYVATHDVFFSCSVNIMAAMVLSKECVIFSTNCMTYTCNSNSINIYRNKLLQF